VPAWSHSNADLSQLRHRARARVRRRGGMALVYGMVAMVAFTGICLLAVDYGRVRVVKVELQSAADAAARAGAAGLHNGSAYSAAVDVAAQNGADNRPVVLRAGGAEPDVVLGHWDEDARQFVAGGTPVDAVQVTARRTAARSDAVPLTFGPLLGLHTSDVKATAVAVKKAGSPLGFIGLGTLVVGNNSIVAAYRSTSGAPGDGNVTGGAGVGSNGQVTFGNNSGIGGNVTLGPGGTVDTANHFFQDGTTINLPTAMSYQPTESPTVPGSGALDLGENETRTLSGGTYHYTSITLGNGATLESTGPVTIYATGSVTAGNNVRLVAYADKPANLRLRLSPGAGIQAGNGLESTAELYGPQSVFQIGNNGRVVGVAVFSVFEAGNNTTLYHDLASRGDGLGGAGGLGTSEPITLVK
jgi:Flp pilus assembly protein TadG